MLLALFLLGVHANAFTSLSLVAGTQIQLNHLIQFKETNKQNSKANFDPIINLNGQTTNQRLEWGAELLNILSTNQKPELLSSQPVHISPGAILYYLPIWWIVMYGSLSSGKSSVTSS